MACQTCGKSTITQTIAHGTVGLTKSALNVLGANIDVCPDEIRKARLDVCRNCEHSSKNDKFIETKGLTNFSICGLCHCNIYLKTGLLSEHCPKGLWENK